MAVSLVELSERYAADRPRGGTARQDVVKLYERYMERRTQSVLDAAAAASAVNALFLSDQINVSQITPQMSEAFTLAYPNVDLMTLSGRSTEEVRGFLSAWKGKLFEVQVRDQLNAEEWVGDIRLAPGQSAVLAESVTQRGWDLQILDADGTVARDLQLKATESLSYVKRALERYPDVEILTTEEVMEAGGDAAAGVLGSDYSDSTLERAVLAPMADLLDSPIEQLAEGLLIGLPIVLIVATEGRSVILRRKDFTAALHDGIFRLVKSGVATGVGALAVLLGGGPFLSLPATFLTRIGLDRVRVVRRLEANLNSSIAELRELAARRPAGFPA